MYRFEDQTNDLEHIRVFLQDEFLALMAKKTKEAEDERELREVFRVFDKNSRGVIDV